MAHGALNEITPWRRRSLTIPPNSWRAWVHLAVWEAWMGMLLFSFVAFGSALIVSSPDRIVTMTDVSGCYRNPPIAMPCERTYQTGAMYAAFSALGGLMSLVVAAWFIWELWSAVAPKPITDDFLRLLNDSFGRRWRDPRTWPWSRVMWAYGFTLAGVVFAAGFAALVWTATTFRTPVKAPVVHVETSQDFRVAQ
jgi:hypothetical protein